MNGVDIAFHELGSHLKKTKPRDIVAEAHKLSIEYRNFQKEMLCKIRKLRESS